MSYESREVRVLPSGLFFIAEVEDGEVCSTIQLSEYDPNPFGDQTRMVRFRSAAEGLSPSVLGATFNGGGWCDLLVADRQDVEALGGFDAIVGDVQAFWSEPPNIICG